MEYMDVKTASERWSITERRITTLCRDGRIKGAKKEKGLWVIPDDVDKPVDGRRDKTERAVRSAKQSAENAEGAVKSAERAVKSSENTEGSVEELPLSENAGFNENFSEGFSRYYNREYDADDKEQLLAVIRFQEQLLKSIAQNYISMHIVNLSEDSFLKIFGADYVSALVDRYTSAQQALNGSMSYLVTEDSLQEALEFLDLSTLPERMGGKSSLIFDFNGIMTGWCQGRFVPVSCDEDGNLKEVIFSVENIQAEKSREEKLLLLSETDALTQLLNRAEGERQINKCLQSGQMGMLCLFDVDDFKAYNDTYGHEAGDKILHRIGACMKDVFAQEDILMRFGGDEFVVFAKEITDSRIGEALIQKLSDIIEDQEFDLFDGTVKISAGIVFTTEGKYREFGQICNAADLLMYMRKREKKRR